MNLSKLTNPSFSKKVIAACCLSLIGAPLFAQSGFDFGVKGIVQTSSLLNSTDQGAGAELNFKNNVSMGAGVSGGYSFTNHLGVEINILYSKQGQGYTGDPTQVTNSNNGIKILSQEFTGLARLNNISITGNYTANIALSTIKIPFLFRYTGNSNKKVYFSSFIGPQINMLSAATVKVNGSEASFDSLHIKAGDLYKKTTIDAVLGVGVGINLSDNLVLSGHLRLDYGMGDVENKSESVTFGGGSPSKFYDNTRAATHNATGGLLISLNYRLVHKTKEIQKTKTVEKSKK